MKNFILIPELIFIGILIDTNHFFLKHITTRRIKKQKSLSAGYVVFAYRYSEKLVNCFMNIKKRI